MTLRRGFFRLWIVFTVLWLSGWGPGAYFGAYHNHPNYRSSEMSQSDAMSEKKPWEDYPAGDPKSDPNNWRRAAGPWNAYLSDMKRYWPGAVLPPIILLALGWLLAWALRGFRQDKGN